MNKRVVGSRYEQVAGTYLEEKGYHILQYNYRNAFGEVDLIAEDADGTIVYCEVKYRRSNAYGDPLEAVDRRKQRKIYQVAACHYADHGEKTRRPCRFDVIAIYGDGTIRHISNAFGG